MKKVLILLACSLFLLASVGTVGAQDVTNLVFLGRDGSYEDAMKVAINEYHELNPDVRIEYLGLPWSGLREKITVELVEGRGDFDLIILDDPWTAEFLPAGLLENLDSWYAESETELSDDLIDSLVKSRSLAIS